MRFYVIVHIATGELMPLMNRGRGYSHWNPGNPSTGKVFARLNVPRLLASEKQALRVAELWSQYPSAMTQRIELDSLLYNESNTTKPDGRKREDVRIQAVDFVFAS